MHVTKTYTKINLVNLKGSLGFSRLVVCPFTAGKLLALEKLRSRRRGMAEKSCYTLGFSHVSMVFTILMVGGRDS